MTPKWYQFEKFLEDMLDVIIGFINPLYEVHARFYSTKIHVDDLK